ncbi:hypothetical protein POSPLADRAFT_1066114 [Postia placenta MAD-698-R-SB12]|uniref:Uncharacterized protein n=1 Tax=Postia placenta MAD-698-R-SB12 TaxID=670580 RepID=A0A1X6N1A8_9APHY|nr:hypothetical protein POSPLADRAFT_1066114 [Postia placenta MAD-698-R-SB12]OSX62280.1 hypothetical protein POSPLADRAFT_1066114 [Postia placenta MAD-698-R-SB12]
MAHKTDSSDDEAPETFTFNSSKQVAKGAQDTLEEYQAAEKSKRKQKNREKDRVLKERAEQAKQNAARKGKGRAPLLAAGRAGSDEAEDEEEGRADDELEVRMRRAMREAEEESDVGEGSSFEGLDGSGSESEEGGLEEDEDEDASASSHFDSEDGEEAASDQDEQVQEGSSSEEETDNAASILTNALASKNHLPDHLFKSAFSKVQSVPSSSKRKFDVSADAPRLPSKKRRHQPKDLLVGSRTIRTLANPSPAVPSVAPRALMPPARVNKFLKRSLNVKGSIADCRTKGWDRKSANVGVMKRSGPAASFVRG